MNEWESVSTAMSIILSRFKYLPMAKYYDNRRILSKSVHFRFPWIKDQTIIMSHRFHYRSHRPNTVTDPDSYEMCKSHLTSEAKSI